MNRDTAKFMLQQLHLQRAQSVAAFISTEETLVDSGSARAERVADWPMPIGDEDFGGFLVVTDRQMIYSDRLGTIQMPWNSIKRLQKHWMRMAHTTGLEVQFTDGRIWAFSGNTPFIKQLIKYHSRVDVNHRQ